MDAKEKVRREAPELWKLVIMYRNGPETKICRMVNMLPGEFTAIRENMITAGIKHRDPDVRGHGWIIMPFDIISFEFWKQENFIEP